jgi:YegS/Rv2252/BmrU family lipid kinase
MLKADKSPIEVHAIINPISGVGSKRKIPHLLEEVFASRPDYRLNISFTEYAGHARQLTREAVERKTKYIIAVGGDGTVNEVATAMVDSDSILGIIPKGSGNGLARELHIPLDSKHAIEVIQEGNVTTIDACLANGRIFFTTCGIGFDAAVSSKFAGSKRRGSLTYVRNAIEEYLKYQPEIYELYIDKECLTEKAFLVACGNASQYGYNAYIAPNASLTDGFMDVTILTPFTPLDIPAIAVQLFTRNIDKSNHIKIIRTDKLTIKRPQPGIMHLDGDPVEVGERIDISVMPKVLKVVTPANVTFKQELRNLFWNVTGFFN